MDAFQKCRHMAYFFMLKTSNMLLENERIISRLEHDRIIIFGGSGDPVLSDVELAKLNQLGEKIWSMKREFEGKTAQLRRMKMSYYKNISRKHNCSITTK